MSDKQPSKQSVAMKAFCKAIKPAGTDITPDDLEHELDIISLELDFSETDIHMIRHKFLTTGKHAGLLDAELDHLSDWIDNTYDLSVACSRFCKKWNDAHRALLMCDDELRDQIKKAIAEK